MFSHIAKTKMRYFLSLSMKLQKHKRRIDQSREINKHERKLVENTHVLCKDGWLVIPTKLQYRAIAWYHHYLQHPGHTRLEETLKEAMYWTDMRSSVRQFVKQCSKHNYGK